MDHIGLPLWLTPMMQQTKYQYAPDLLDPTVVACVCTLLHFATHTWNTSDLQNLGDTTCDHWALFFLENGANKWVGVLWAQPGGQQRLDQALVALHLNSSPISGKPSPPWAQNISSFFFCRLLVGQLSDGVERDATHAFAVLGLG